MEGNISPEERKFGSGVEAYHQVLGTLWIKEPIGDESRAPQGDTDHPQGDFIVLT